MEVRKLGFAVSVWALQDSNRETHKQESPTSGLVKTVESYKICLCP
jgi:hypothetical protein